MREKESGDKTNIDQYGFRPLEAAKKRLDLNDLLNRVKKERTNDRKLNLLILSGAVLVAAVFCLLLSL